MSMYYDPHTNGFYLKRHAPKSAVEISNTEYRALLTAQENGQKIVPDADGNPIAVTRVPNGAGVEQK